MVVKQVFDHSLRDSGKRFLSSLKASNRYSEGYLASLETTMAMASLKPESTERSGEGAGTGHHRDGEGADPADMGRAGPTVACCR